jgi:RimJ/RimL family protein N-acetyltransferase
MEHFPAMLTHAESDAFVDRIEARFDRQGFGLWAVEVVGVVPFIGFVGLNPPSFEAHFTPAIEIGWRLARAHWGRGYATEGAKAALAFGFEQLGLAEIVSFTVPANEASWRVMERLGMTRDPADDFDHPALPVGHPLRRHILYRLGSPAAQPMARDLQKVQDSTDDSPGATIDRVAVPAARPGRRPGRSARSPG